LEEAERGERREKLKKSFQKLGLLQLFRYVSSLFCHITSLHFRICWKSHPILIDFSELTPFLFLIWHRRLRHTFITEIWIGLAKTLDICGVV
jgi:hypothetical protein